MDLLPFLESCLSYPSGDNAQPFRFRILSQTQFEVFFDNKIAHHRLDPNKTASLLAFGSLLELISLQALKIGYKLEFETYFPQALKQEGLSKWAKVLLRKSKDEISETDLNLQIAIGIRCTDRRNYKTEPLPERVIQWLTSEANKTESLAFAFHDRLSPQLEKTLLNIEEEAWKDTKAVADVFSWIRLTDRVAKETRNGMTWRSLGLAFFQKPMVQIFRDFPNFYKFLIPLGATKQNRFILKNQIRHSGGFGWVAIKKYEPLEILEAGRIVMRMWLYLNKQGYGFQPMTLGVLPAFESHFEKLPKDWAPQLKSMYNELLDVIQKDSMMKREFIPLWGFRTGLIAPLPVKARTLRQSIHDLIIGVD